MSDAHRCESCKKSFKTAEALTQHNANKHEVVQKRSGLSSSQKKNIKFWVIGVVIIGIISLAINVSTKATTLPPTTMVNHIEATPPNRILKEPMGIKIHRHMLEHAGGIEGGRGGVIINYDCKRFDCEPDLIENLEAFATEFDFVYVAPYKNMKAKIVITKLNRQQVLDTYNEEVIRGFLGSAI